MLQNIQGLFIEKSWKVLAPLRPSSKDINCVMYQEPDFWG